MFKSILILLSFLILSTNAFANSRTIVTVSHPITEYFLKKIANDKLYIKVVYEKDSFFDINSLDDIDKFGSSNYYFTLNLNEEKELLTKLKAYNKDLKIIDSTSNINKINNNPYIWMDPILARELAQNIYEQLIAIRSYDKAYFLENLNIFLEEIDSIYLHLKRRIDNSELYGFFIFNNKLDYFAKRYLLKVFHKEYRYLKLDEVSQIIEISKKEHINHVVLDQGQSYLIAQSVNSSINGKIVEIDIFDGNWKSTMYNLITNLTNN